MASLVIAMGTIAVLFVLVSIYVGASSSSWRRVRGKVLSSSVKGRSCNPNTGYCLSYYPAIKYSYDIEGKTYQSDFIGNYLLFGSDRDVATRIVEQFPTDNEVTVYINPLFKGVSVLSPGIKQPLLHLVLLIVALILAIAGVVIVAM